jgi:hypothetical protein
MNGASADQPTPEANGYGVGSAARLQLGEQVSHVRLHRLLGQEETLADLTVDEPVGDELQDLDLAGGGILLVLARGRRREGDHGSGAACAAPGSSRLEAATVIAVAIEDLLALGSVHAARIGVSAGAL